MLPVESPIPGFPSEVLGSCEHLDAFVIDERAVATSGRSLPVCACTEDLSLISSCYFPLFLLEYNVVPQRTLVRLTL